MGTRLSDSEQRNFPCFDRRVDLLFEEHEDLKTDILTDSKRIRNDLKEKNPNFSQWSKPGLYLDQPAAPQKLFLSLFVITPTLGLGFAKQLYCIPSVHINIRSYNRLPLKCEKLENFCPLNDESSAATARRAKRLTDIIVNSRRLG